MFFDITGESRCCWLKWPGEAGAQGIDAPCEIRPNRTKSNLKTMVLAEQGWALRSPVESGLVKHSQSLDAAEAVEDEDEKENEDDS